MHKTDLLKKFLNNCCNEEESRLAMQYLEAEPWLLDELVSRSEWDEIDGAKRMDPAVETAMRSHVLAKTGRPILRMMKPAMGYAALFSAIAFGIFFLLNSNKREAVSSLASAPQTLPSTHTIHNTTSSTQTFTLADNSTLMVYPGSIVEYDVDFISRRSIKLNGKATFHVTKNEGSPFIVYAGDISTTALGTHFLVDNSTDAGTVNVKLFEGRVVVQAIKESLSVRRTFLKAGQQCFVNISSRFVKVESLYNPNKPARVVQAQIISVERDDRLQFSKTPLPEVLSKLQLVYGQSIQFNIADIDGKYFTGSFSAEDSLSTVLKVISDMNDLKYHMNGQSIQLVKAPRRMEQKPADSSAGTIEVPVLIAENKTREPVSITAPPPSIPENITSRPLQPEIIVEESETRYRSVALPEFLKALEKQTKRKIRFDEESLRTINFTGTIPLHQSVRSILTAVCNSNGLNLTVKRGTFYISKP